MSPEETNKWSKFSKNKKKISHAISIPHKRK